MGFHVLQIPFIIIKLTLLIVAALTPTLAAATPTPTPPAPIAKPNCIHRCGNVSIPFPFGTTDECYQSYSFLVTCNQTFNPPKAFLQNTSIEITDISLDGQLRLLQFVAHDCYNRNRTRVSYSDPWINLPTYLTVNNTANKFTIVGCDTYGFVSGRRLNRNYQTGCTAMCDAKEDLAAGSCTGLGCCQTAIPKEVWRVEVILKSYENYSYVWGFNNCSYGFLVEESAFTFSPENLTNLKNVERLPMVVDWAIGNGTCEEAQMNSSSYACKSLNSTCYKPDNGYGYRCSCPQGYQGNPYLVDGCQGIALGVIVLILTACWVHLELKRRRLIRMRQKFFLQNGGILLQEELTRRERSSDTTKIFSAAELHKATNNFHDNMIIGQGGNGIVYKGVLPDHRIVAIKKCKEVDRNQIDQFINEVVVLSQINHRNVVKLLGCCLETQVPLLVYEFISNGTLYEHIHNKAKARLISWDMRLKIAAETAGVLSYLHSAASTPIIHRDVKSANILLDHTYTAKVSDFGASRLVPLDQTQLSTMVQGTFGYLDPEYMQTNQLTEKSDVYSFGVVLVELLTGKKALSYDRPEEERNLANYFLCIMKKEGLVEVVEENVEREGKREEVMKVGVLAKRCLKVRGEERPCMKEVAMELEGLLLRSGREGSGKHLHYSWPWGAVETSDENEGEDEKALVMVGEGYSSSIISNGEGNSSTSIGFDSLSLGLDLRNHTDLSVGGGR
ncbi:UNVERIFIED_CONTAM: Wall-associated receptor kinase [Sesamum latifolium]|uniref:Wall-associated receptor kinase n=1 Tax=Sesamum latifolium TaxID=2727402 RepID=A0AAW2VSC9_9LAMI